MRLFADYNFLLLQTGKWLRAKHLDHERAATAAAGETTLGRFLEIGGGATVMTITTAFPIPTRTEAVGPPEGDGQAGGGMGTFEGLKNRSGGIALSETSPKLGASVYGTGASQAVW